MNHTLSVLIPFPMDRNKATERIERFTFSRRVWRLCKQGLLNMFYFCQLNGSYIALYGLMLPSILMNILSAVFNEYLLFGSSCSFPDFKVDAYFPICRRLGGKAIIVPFL